jgi:hypothetical protein
VRWYVDEILVATVGGAEPTSLQTVRAFAGRGLAGDRYLSNAGTWSSYPDQSGKDLTLIEREVLEDVGLDGQGARRNIVTRGIKLDGLIGRRFRVGEAACAGVRPCEPCRYLEKRTGVSVDALKNRGGLRASILEGGEISIGDLIEIEPDSASVFFIA